MAVILMFPPERARPLLKRMVSPSNEPLIDMLPPWIAIMETHGLDAARARLAAMFHQIAFEHHHRQGDAA